jgi:glycosyltransferase involved in cell wall biosynthesis
MRDSTAAPFRLMLWHWGRNGGGPRYTLELARALAGVPGVEVHVSVSRQCAFAREFAELGVPVLWVDTYTNAMECLRGTLALPSTALRLRRYVREHRIDAVDSTMTHLWTRLCLPALRGTGATLLCTVHDATLHPGEGSRLKDWFYGPVPGVDGYIALTRFVADRLVSARGIAPGRIDILPLGVLGDAAEPAPRVPGGPLRLLFLGRILPYKGLDRLLDAFTLLRNKGRPVVLTIAGAGDLGTDAARLAGMEGVTIHNRWIGEEEIPALINDADCVVLPYVEASQSGVVVSAFPAGVTAIVTPVGGLAEQIRHESDGLIADDTSPEALARAIDRLIAEPDLLDRLREGARRTAVTELSWGAIATRLIGIARARRARGL